MNPQLKELTEFMEAHPWWMPFWVISLIVGIIIDNPIIILSSALYPIISLIAIIYNL